MEATLTPLLEVASKVLLYAAVFLAFDLAAFLIVYAAFAFGVQRFSLGPAFTAGAYSVLGRLFSLQPLLLFALASVSAYYNLHRYYLVVGFSTLFAMAVSMVIQSHGRVIPTISSMFAVSIDEKALGPAIPLLLSSLVSWLMIYFFMRRLL